jgi:hypothetical protein
MRITRLFLGSMLVAASLAAGCATGPRVRSTQDTAVDFSQYSTFGFSSPLGTDREGYQTIVSQQLKTAAQREMEARGMRYDDTSPQLLINFNGKLSDKLRTTSVPSSGVSFGIGRNRGYYGYRTGIYTAWPLYTDTNVDSYTEGTLNIDVVDAARKQMIWEGVAVGRVSEKDLANLQPAIDAGVKAIFEKYPVPALNPAQ